MAIKNFSAGSVKIVSTARGRAHTTPKQLAELPGGLYPMRMAYWESDKYRISSGWPIPEPDCDIRANTLISASGEALSYRENPRGIVTGAPVRWLADDEMFDLTSLQWFPYQSDFPMIWTTAADYSPTFIDDYEYVINEETFTENAMNFDSDSFEHMWADFGQLLGGASGYSMVMCLSLSSVYGNSTLVPYSGLWCPGQPTPAVGEPISETPDGGWVSLTLQGTSLYLQTDQSPRVSALSISDLLASTAPIMIGLVIGRPNTFIYAGRGPSNIRRASVNVGTENTALDGRVVLGRTNGDILHTADMALLDLGVYPDRLTAAEMKAEFATLSAVYGGDK